MAAIMNTAQHTAQRFARITTIVNMSKQLIADYPLCPLVLAQCITYVENALKAEPGAADAYVSPDWHTDCARAILGVLPRCTWAELRQTDCVWVDFDYEECDDDCQCGYCEAEHGPRAADEATAPVSVLDMCDDPC